MPSPSRRTFAARFRARVHRVADREAGSLILDILIGMAIFSLTAVIATSAVSQYRARAYEQAVVSDVKNLGLAMEAYLIEHNALPSESPTYDSANPGTVGVNIDVTMKDDGWIPTRENHIRWYDRNLGNEDFIVCVQRGEYDRASGDEGEAFAWYASYTGGVLLSGREGGCAGSSCDEVVVDSWNEILAANRIGPGYVTWC